MAAAVVLALALVGMAAWDLREPVSRRRWHEVAAYAGLWLAGTSLALAGAAGVPLPSLARLIIDVVRPVSRWVP